MLVKFTGAKQEISDKFAFFGKNTDSSYIEYIKEKLRKKAIGNENYNKLL